MIGAHLWRIAKRNAQRHRAQAIAAAAAVAVGTMVLSASLLAGAAAEGGIRQVAFDVLGETDEMVRTDGDFFFPEPAANRFAQEVNDRREDVHVSPTVTHTAVANSPEGFTEPDTLLVGYPTGEKGFGAFDALAGTGQLQQGQGALVNERLAEGLDLQVGDELQLRYTQPQDPMVPQIHRFQGNITGGGSLQPVPDAPDAGLPASARQPVTERFPVPVSSADERIVAVLAWGSPENTTDLDLALESPSGERLLNTNGTSGDPDAPAFLNASLDEQAAGEWTAEVRAEAAVEQPFHLVVIVLRPAYTLEELREARQTLQEMGPLAEEIQQRIGQTQTASVPVSGIVTGEGKGGFTGEAAAFLPMQRLQGLLDREGEVNLVRISNPGGPRQGLVHTEEIMPVLEASLNATKTQFPDPSVQALSLEPSKQQIVDRAEQAGSDFTRFLTTLSSFTIVAGVLLVVNLFTMLGEERRVEMSVMRALGTKRSHLTSTITLEGLIYALLGAPVGALSGLGLAYVLIEAVNAFVIGPESLPIPFVLDWGTVLVAAIAGMAFTVLAVLFTGLRLSRLNIASGLKDRRETGSVKQTSILLAATLILGALLTLAYLPTGAYTLLLVGPSALIAAIAWRAVRGWGPRIARFAASLPLVVYGLWTVIAFQNVSAAEAAYLSTTRGVLLVLAAVVALLNAPGLPRLLKAIARRSKKLAPASIVAAAYPTRKQLRTGLTASMFALVILVLIFFSTFFTVFEVDPDREAGGYDIRAESRLPVEDLDAWAEANLDEPAASLDRVDEVHELPMARIVGGDVVTIDGEQPHYQGPPIDVFYGVTPDFAEQNDYELVSQMQPLPAEATAQDGRPNDQRAEAESEGASDRVAYQLIRQNSSYAIVSRVYDVDHAGRLGHIQGGESLAVGLGTRSVDLKVLGAQSQRYLGGIFVHPDTVQDLFPSHRTVALITVPTDEDPQAVARQLEADFQQLGLDAESIRDQAIQTQQQNARFFTVLQVFLGIGLVIGVASLGIVTAKAALEREQELGVMRAMGIPRRHVTASLVGEALLTAVLGILPGLGIGIAAAYAAWLAFFADAGVAFSVPWGSIAILIAISLAATVASTLPPARKAANKSTAKAVRVRG